MREDTGTASDDTRYSNKGVEIGPPEVAERDCDGEFGYADMHVQAYPLVRRIVQQDSTERDFVKNSQHGSGTAEEEVRDDGFRVGKMEVRHLKRLGVNYIQVSKNDNMLRVYSLSDMPNALAIN